MKAFLYLFLLHTLSPASAPLEAACKKASESNAGVGYDFCMTSLQVVPGSNAADARGLAFITGGLARANFTSTTAKIEGLLSDAGLPDDARAALTNCSAKYVYGHGDVSSAVHSIKSGDLSTAKRLIGRAMVGVSRCGAVLDRAKVKALVEENENAIGLTNMMQIFTILIA